MLRVVSEIFGSLDELATFGIYREVRRKGPKRTLPREAKFATQWLYNVDGMGRLFGGKGDTCAIQHCFTHYVVDVFHAHCHAAENQAGPPRVSVEEVCRILAARSRLAPPIRLALQNSPVGLTIPLTYLERCIQLDSTAYALFRVCSFDSNANSKTACSRERLKKSEAQVMSRGTAPTCQVSASS